MLFDVKPAIPVKVNVTDFDGKPTTGRFTFTDAAGPRLPAAGRSGSPRTSSSSSRSTGPTAARPAAAGRVHRGVRPRAGVPAQDAEGQDRAPAKGEPQLAVKLERWVNPADYGLFSGDHHIHAAGCATTRTRPKACCPRTCSCTSRARG